MRYLSKWDLEQLARRVSSAYQKLPDAKANPRRINPDILLEQLLKLEIDYRHLSRDRNTLGLTAYDDVGVEVYDGGAEEMYFMDGKTVLIEQDLRDAPYKVGRFNFTKVHEGCHHILNMVFPGRIQRRHQRKKSTVLPTAPARHKNPQLGRMAGG